MSRYVNLVHKAIGSSVPSRKKGRPAIEAYLHQTRNTGKEQSEVLLGYVMADPVRQAAFAKQPSAFNRKPTGPRRKFTHAVTSTGSRPATGYLELHARRANE